MRKLVYLCDWLPPDFGAVGQYSLTFARERAAAGEDVLLAGFSTQADSVETCNVGTGRLTVVRLKTLDYDRSDFAKRALWTLKVNGRLMWRLRRELRTADEILFTGSPPFLLHFIAPLCLLWRKRTVYRITDFHPECLMVGLSKSPFLLRLFYWLTVAWRKTIHEFEVLGEDQRGRLLELGIPAERIRLKRDPCPVAIPADTLPLEKPAELADYVVLLYSGNFGVAHDHETFVESYRQHHRTGSRRVALWLNAVGAKADLVEQLIREAGLPIHRSRPVDLDLLPRLLITPDAHLITLRDEYVGYVLPSKVHGCIESMCDILYIGSGASDVHLLCSEKVPGEAYSHVPVGRPDLGMMALEAIADRAEGRIPHSVAGEFPAAWLRSTQDPAVRTRGKRKTASKESIGQRPAGFRDR